MSVTFNRLLKRARAAPNETEFVRPLAGILSSMDGQTFILTLERADAELCIHTLDYALAKRNLLHTFEKQVFLHILERLSGKHTILPEAMVITDEIDYPGGSDQPQLLCSFADIKRGRYKGRTVAVKTTRVGTLDDFRKIRERFCTEVIIWNSLSHPNVLELVGVLGGFGGHQFATVSKWMKHGTIMEYIRVNATNRLKLLHDAAQGLKYLHDENIVHGDVKGASILMKNSTPPSVCLAGFEFITLALDPHLASLSLAFQGGTLPFMAPELLVPYKFGFESSGPTRKTDIYAFGLVILQVLTGQQPFRNYRPQELTNRVLLGDCPEKPPNAEEIGISHGLWMFTQTCWDRNIDRRPHTKEIVDEVGYAAAKWNRNMPPSGEERWEGSVEEESDEPKSVSEPPPDEDYSHLFQDSSPSSTDSGELPTESKGALEDLSDPDLPPAKPSNCNTDSGSPLPISGLGHSVEIPTLLTPPDAMDVPSSNPPPLKLRDINIESQDNLSQEFIDRLDMTLDHATSDQERHALLNILCKMCGRLRTLPKSMYIRGYLSGELVEVDSGGRAVIFRAQHNTRQVAVKTIRITTSNFDKCLTEFCREAVAWRHLRHPNILPLLGVDSEPHRFSMISEWMDQGNINEYMETHGDVDCLQLLAEAATGLEYMHSLNMVHGDLKGANILVKSHRARLADFGLSTIVSGEHNAIPNTSLISLVSEASLMSFTAGGTLPWMSPELLDPERFGANDDRPTKKSDCYAFGMVVYEVLSGNSPYWDITNQDWLVYAIIEGYRPKKPVAAESLGFTNELWETVQRCWLTDASARPDVRAILSHLNHAAWSWERRWSVQLR